MDVFDNFVDVSLLHNRRIFRIMQVKSKLYMLIRGTLFLGCVFFILSSACGQGYPFENSRLSRVDDLRIHYRYWEGAGAQSKGSCLLVHGFGGSTFSWEAVADSLHRLGYEVVAIDIPPFGYSDKSHRINQSVTAHAQRIHKFIHQEFPGRCWHFAGHSMGGAVVQAYALMFPEDLTSVTFVAAALFTELPRVERTVHFLLRLSPVRYVAGELAEEWLLTYGRLERLLESAYGVAPDRQQVLAYLDPLTVPGTARAILSAAAFHKEIKKLDAANLEVRSIAIWGDADTWVGHRSKLPALDRMSETELVLLEGVGHNPMETHFDEMMEAWLPFLIRHSSPDPYDH